MSFIYNLTDTWDNISVAFDGIKINVTDTASAAASKLLDLKINNTSKFNVSKTGSVTAAGVVESTAGGFKFPDGTTQTAASPRTLADLDDVDLSNLVDGNVLCYASSLNKWRNEARENLVDGGNF
jgi:hypothetical protein